MVKNALCRTILRGFFITLTSRRAEQRIRIFVTQTQECSENSFTVMFFVSNNIPRALRKYRTANDREIHYGNERGRFSLFCYAYIFEANDIKRARFIDVGIGRNQVIRLVATSALVSHLFQSCQGDATKLLIMGGESKI